MMLPLPLLLRRYAPLFFPFRMRPGLFPMLMGSSASRRSRSASCRQASSSRFWFHHSCAAALAMDNGSTATDSNITRRLNMRDLFDGG